MYPPAAIHGGTDAEVAVRSAGLQRFGQWLLERAVAHIQGLQYGFLQDRLEGLAQAIGERELEQRVAKSAVSDFRAGSRHDAC